MTRQMPYEPLPASVLLGDCGWLEFGEDVVCILRVFAVENLCAAKHVGAAETVVRKVSVAKLEIDLTTTQPDERVVERVGAKVCSVEGDASTLEITRKKEGVANGSEQPCGGGPLLNGRGQKSHGPLKLLCGVEIVACGCEGVALGAQSCDLGVDVIWKLSIHGRCEQSPNNSDGKHFCRFSSTFIGNKSVGKVR
jgi:hypothetical protein